MLSKKMMTWAAIAAALTIASCNKDQLKSSTSAVPQITTEAAMKDLIAEGGANPDERMLNNESMMMKEGYVYTESNDAMQNSILIYKQQKDGMLSYWKAVASGGKGTGAGLGSQGALALSKNHQWLFAVNAGDNSISSFKVNEDGSLTLVHTVSSGGVMPISVTVYNQWLYVVNSMSANICGFQVEENGMLAKMENSSQMLSDVGAAPAQIKFHPGGMALFVTEKAANKIAVFPVNEGGIASAATFSNSVGQTPFGFEFVQTNNYLIVSNAFGGAVNAGSCSSYATDYMGNISTIKGDVKNNQSAPCWVAPTQYGRFAFVTNTGSNSISSYYVAPNGKLFHAFFAQTPAGAAPIDIVVSGNNGYVYNLNANSHSISQYKRGVLGTLKSMGEVTGLPDAAVGLVAY